MDGSDEFDGEDFDDEFLDYSDVEDGGGESDGDEVVVPLRNMKKWLENRPRGFGEGKVYDTTIEDELMEELEQSRIAQLASVNKLKNNPVGSSSKKETSKKDEDPQRSHDGFRVRLVNLPKKKNIHRDLRLAFQGVPGIVNIVPVVSGNEKTRDPVCKGLAFVDFKKKDEAQRFMQSFSGKSICFGKLQKQIKCEMVNSKLPKPECDQYVDEGNFPSQQPVLSSDEDVDAGSENNDVLLYSLEESVPIELDDADERRGRVSGQQEEDDGGINVASTASDSDSGDEQVEGQEPAIKPSSLKQTRKAKRQPKKEASRRVKANAPKLNIPASAKKLQVREKAVLSGVFSKYGAIAASASTVKEQSR
ncbi:RNA-binding family protein [Perilla frutescens var. hirtella]|nr:RNA-binding family protein [Perilla frutescens var. hirtella]KAH6815633.1 RNA-binding family protein [Perilla frutescens var. frutescens]